MRTKIYISKAGIVEAAMVYVAMVYISAEVLQTKWLGNLADLRYD